MEKLTKLQRNFLKVLDDKGYNISAASEIIGVNRRTYYRWLRNKSFAEEVNFQKEEKIDYVESKLMMNIKTGHEASIFFFLKTQAKHRGYVEKQEIVHGGSMPSLVELVKKYKDEKKKNHRYGEN